MQRVNSGRGQTRVRALGESDDNKTPLLSIWVLNLHFLIKDETRVIADCSGHHSPYLVPNSVCTKGNFGHSASLRLVGKL